MKNTDRVNILIVVLIMFLIFFILSSFNARDKLNQIQETLDNLPARQNPTIYVTKYCPKVEPVHICDLNTITARCNEMLDNAETIKGRLKE